MIAVEELLNIIRGEIGRALALHSRPKKAVVTAWDPDNHLAKVRPLPSDANDSEAPETGWIPVNNDAIGDGHGDLMAPWIGDQVTVGFQEGDPDSPEITGRIHSDEQKPPRLESGEGILKFGKGHTLFFDKEGNVHIKSAGGGKVLINGSGSTP